MFKKRFLILMASVLGLTSCDFSIDKLVNQVFPQNLPNNNENISSDDVNSNSSGGHTSTDHTHNEDANSNSSGGHTSTDHVHNFILTDSSEKYLATEATCQKPATYYYSCECGEHGSETFEYGEKGDHSFKTAVLPNSDDFTYSGRFECLKCEYCGYYSYPSLFYDHDLSGCYLLFDGNYSFLDTSNYGGFVVAAFKRDKHTNCLVNYIQIRVSQLADYYLVRYFSWNLNLHSWDTDPYAFDRLYVDSNRSRVDKCENFIFKNSYNESVLHSVTEYEYEDGYLIYENEYIFLDGDVKAISCQRRYWYFPGETLYYKIEQSSYHYDSENDYKYIDVSTNEYYLDNRRPKITERLKYLIESDNKTTLIDGQRNEYFYNDNFEEIYRYVFDAGTDEWIEYSYTKITRNSTCDVSCYYRFINGAWVIYSMSCSYFDNQTKEILKEEHYVLSDNNTLFLRYYHEYIRDEYGRAIVYIFCSRETENDNFVIEYKYEYFYSNSDDIDPYMWLYYCLDENKELSLSKKCQRCYDDNNNYLGQEVYEWDSENNTWVLISDPIIE